MKYIKINTSIVAVLLIVLCACNRDELFEREQYKAVVAIKSEGESNFFNQILDLNSNNKDEDGFVRGFISANVGGTSPTTEPIVITLTEDADMLNQYNLYNNETDADKYYRFLPKNRYKIPEMKITIPAGKRDGIMPIWINADGLSPDSVYIIPFRVVRCSAYEMNPEKSTVFYRVERKNEWSYTSANGNTLSAPSYSQRGSWTSSAAIYNQMTNWLNGDPGVIKPSLTQLLASKTIWVVSHNELRMFGSTKVAVDADADPAVFYPRWCINIKIEDEKIEFEEEVEVDGEVMMVKTPTNMHKITLTHWREDHIEGIQLTQIDNDVFNSESRYLNSYELVTDDWGFKYHVFRLCYDFVEFGSTILTPRRIWEELRLDYTEDLNKK
ncbi:MAG: DUF1735 domain-containing protein [Bacteroidales bacterium]|jgi:hypothetical protein|nr:DUF1735 domain-containing protein [Bacteroidales bacterium]